MIPRSRMAFHGLVSLILLSCIPAEVLVAAGVEAQYLPKNFSAVTMSDGGTTNVLETSVGHVGYINLTLKNTNGTDITTSAVSISNVVGCTVMRQHFNTGTIHSGNSMGGEIAVRPSSSTWSLQVSVEIIGDPYLTSFTQTLTASGIVTATGPQLEVVGYMAPYVHAESGGGNSFVGAVAVGEPVALWLRSANRSTLQSMTIASPGGSVVGPPTNCTVSFESQPSSTLATDASAFTTVRLTPLAIGNFSAEVQLVSDGTGTPFTQYISGSADGRLRLSVLNGTTKLNRGYSNVMATIPLNVHKLFQFTIRNDDTVPITFSVDVPYRVSCFASTHLPLPQTTLSPGQQTVWTIDCYPIATNWSLTAFVDTVSPTASNGHFELTSNPSTDQYQDPPSSSVSESGSSSSCGAGSGLSALFLLGLVGYLGFSSVRSRRQEEH